MQRFEALKRTVELGQMTRAAAELGYTQSALSQMLSALEAEVGFRLLDRSRKGCILTPEGEELMPLINQALNAERRVREKAAEINGLQTGTVRIGTIASVSAHWLPPLMKEFEAAHPGVEFVIHQGDYKLIPAWINEGLVDFGFVNPRGVSGLTMHPVREGAMSAVLPPDHPLADLEVVPLRELAKEPFILLEEGGYYEPLEAFREAGCKPHVKYTIHDDYSIMAMVSEGLGVTVLANLIMESCPYDLVTRPTDPPITRQLAVAYKDEARLPIAAKRFISLILARADSLP
ncbi:MAG: LysR family transcriptional regulator [Eggerthellaceae bacterium]|nr:LysR family transcriptional regulator [Eggerthellaceae bacterium]